MAWKINERLAARSAANYSAEEIVAFREGYREGFDRKPQRQHEYPNAYGAGYWEGYDDAPSNV